ncbi:MAG: peptidylprolyl isomerase [Puniceicoccaceae bacterium]
MRGKIRHPVWKIGLLAAFLAGGCSDPTDTVPKEEADIIVATVGDREITLKDVADQVRASEGALSPGAVLDQLIRRHALIDSALAAGLGESEDVVAAWENALIRELRRTQLDPRLATADPEERDLRSLYERDYRRFQQPERRRLAVVLLADQDAAEAFLAKWKEKADRPVESGFGQFAFEHSLHDRSRYRGGRRPPARCARGAHRKRISAAFPRRDQLSDPCRERMGFGPPSGDRPRVNDWIRGGPIHLGEGG